MRNRFCALLRKEVQCYEPVTLRVRGMQMGLGQSVRSHIQLHELVCDVAVFGQMVWGSRISFRPNSSLPGRAIIDTMPIRMGIMCERCGKVYFIGYPPVEGSPIQFDSQVPPPMGGPYKLTCASSCKAVRFFEKSEMKPYVVSTGVYHRGYAQRGEYQEVPTVPHREK